MLTIFDLVTAPELASYWNALPQHAAPYLGEVLFPPRKKRGLNLKYIKGAHGLPVVLSPSAFDAKAKPRDRIGFSTVQTQMPFFKESTYIDEEMRQELNIVLETGNQAYIDSVMNQVFDDEMRLLDGARAQRERMRMQLLTTGLIAISANGQEYNYDFGVPSEHKATTLKSWSDPAADVIGDIRTWQEKVYEDTGVKPTRAICNGKTWQYFLKNTAILKAHFVLTNGEGVLDENKIRSYLKEVLDLSVEVNNKKFMTEAGVATKFVGDDIFVLLPEGDLGFTWFGTTPEESDLMANQLGQNSKVTVVDTGVAVATCGNFDPVNVETKVSMICLPSFEQADKIFIGDVAV